jgi:NADPH:quinone reductase-like Zn-dependent oxidoreductase
VPKHNGVDRLMPVTHTVAMHGIEVSELGGPEVLSYVGISQPAPAAGEVLITAEAIGVNFIDTYFRSGLYPHDLPFVLGAEVAGTVAATGNGVTGLRVGDRVATADAVGAYADTALRQQVRWSSRPSGPHSDQRVPDRQVLEAADERRSNQFRIASQLNRFEPGQ